MYIINHTYSARDFIYSVIHICVHSHVIENECFRYTQLGGGGGGGGEDEVKR